MKIQIAYADKVLWLANHIRSPQYLCGSKSYGWISYEISEPKITLDKCTDTYNFYNLSSNSWLVDLIIRHDYLKNTSYWNGDLLESQHLNTQAGYDIKAEFVGDFDQFLEDVTFLWFCTQN